MCSAFSTDCRAFELESDSAGPPSGKVAENVADEHSRLSRDEAMGLYLRCREGKDPSAKNYLTQALKRYVIAIALKYCQCGVPLDQLIAAGEVGVVRALERFDSKRNRQFLTYVAYCIRARILDHLVDSRPFRDADADILRSKLFLKFCREKARLANFIGEEPPAVGLRTKRIHRKPLRAFTCTAVNTGELNSDAAQ